ncbi:hypothetical protein [Flavobacterium cupreum]|uniref:hypothetical protein n=1 Tax=Flavobacterium cupreum TaxID=2133766 RepID=UPI0026B0A46C
MALTDINTVTGIYDFIKGCIAFGIKPLVGIEFRCNLEIQIISKNNPSIITDLI